MDIYEVMKMVKKSYEQTLAQVYPSWGSNGFTERNQTFNFCSQYRNLSNNAQLFIWQEMNLNNSREHLDCVIIDGDTIYLIETKRLKNRKSVEAINKDMERFERIVLSQDKPLRGLNDSKKVVRIVLADFWLPRQKGREQKLSHRNAFFKLCNKRQYKIVFNEEILSGGSRYVSDNEEYYLMCAMKED